MGDVNMKEALNYEGKTIYFKGEMTDHDEAQAFVEHYRKLGYIVCALNENGKYQIYIENKEV